MTLDKENGSVKNVDALKKAYWRTCNAETPEGVGEDVSGIMMEMSEPLRAQIKEAAARANKRND